MISSDLSLYGCNDCAARWFVTFDGRECYPTPIDMSAYVYGPKLNLHRPAVMTGHCKISKSGSVNIGFNVAPLRRTGTVWTGHLTSVRIYIEEVEAPQ